MDTVTRSCKAERSYYVIATFIDRLTKSVNLILSRRKDSKPELPSIF